MSLGGCSVGGAPIYDACTEEGSKNCSNLRTNSTERLREMQRKGGSQMPNKEVTFGRSYGSSFELEGSGISILID